MVLQYHQSASKSRFRFIRREMSWYKQQGTVAARVLTQYYYCTEFVPVLAPSSCPLFIGLRQRETCSHWRWKKKVQYFLLVLWSALHLCKSALTLLRLGGTLTQSAPAHHRGKAANIRSRTSYWQYERYCSSLSVVHHAPLRGRSHLYQTAITPVTQRGQGQYGLQQV